MDVRYFIFFIESFAFSPETNLEPIKPPNIIVNNKIKLSEKFICFDL